ncbi:MAG TPA: HAMP domain-containing sensor histidine kinase [Nitrosopumilaceae archaeon]|nr:HAMP domain-containing sensor histidine kinase [Nitrosopumilaceae archaeon]
MKLLVKSYIYYFTISLFIFISGTVAIYYSILSKINNKVTEHLKAEKIKVLSQLQYGRTPEEINSNVGDHIYVMPVASLTKPLPVITDTSYAAEEVEEEGAGDKEAVQYLSFRQLLFQAKVHGKYFEITISKSLSENKEVSESVIAIVALLASLMLIILILVNYRISKQIWAPFYDTVNKLKLLDLSKNKKTELKHSDIREFQVLNEVIHNLLERIRHDYGNLKEFTENTAHELQTPLAIISSKLELLLQTDNLSAEQGGLVKSAYSSLQRLSKLNQALLLLTRIENRQFNESKNINLTALIRNKISEFEDFIEMKKLKVDFNSTDDILMRADPLLIDVMVNNLLNNAIKHNFLEGSILIETNGDQLKISNTSENPEIEQDNLFKRFRKGKNTDSTGLGLAIVEKVCEYYNYKIAYRYTDNQHSFSIIIDN